MAGQKNASSCAVARVLLTLPNHKSSDTVTLTPCNPGDKVQHYVCFAFDWRGKGSRSLYHKLWPGLLVHHPLLFPCLSLSLSCTCTLQLTDLKTVTFLSEFSLSLRLTLLLPHSPFSLKAQTFRVRASVCHLSSQQFVSIFSLSSHVLYFVVEEEENFEMREKKKGEVTVKHFTEESWTS